MKKNSIISGILFAAFLLSACKPRAFHESAAVNDETTEGESRRDPKAFNCVEVSPSVKKIFEKSRDMFAEKFFDTGNCPDDIPLAGTVLQENGCTVVAEAPAKDLKVGRVVVSETALYKKIAQANGINPRFVEVWDCGEQVKVKKVDGTETVKSKNDSIKDKIYIAGPGGGVNPAFHVIAFDPATGGFNFYSNNPGDTPNSNSNKKFVFHGNSFRQRDESTTKFRSEKFPHHPCTQCHVNGALLMKELRLPWLNWHAKFASVSQLQDFQKLSESTDKARRQVVVGEILEQDVEKSAVLVNQTVIRQIKAKKPMFRPQGTDEAVEKNLTLRGLLKPLFCQTEMNFATAQFVRRSFFVPPDLYVNRLLIPEGGKFINIKGVQKGSLPSRLDMTSFDDDEDFSPQLTPSRLNTPDTAFSFPLATFDESQWRKALVRLNVKLPAAAGVKEFENTDGRFPMLVPGRSFVDDDFVSQLVREKVIEEELAAAVLMVDYPNPAFSKTRCDLLKAIPNDDVYKLEPAAITQIVTKVLEVSELVGAKEYLEWIAKKEKIFQEGAKEIMAYAAKCKSAFASATTEQFAKYYELTKTKRMAIRFPTNIEGGVRTEPRKFPEERSEKPSDKFLFGVEGFIINQIYPTDSLPANPKKKLDKNCAVVPE